MATTTAALTIDSSDLVGDALSLSTTKELHKAGTAVGLEQTTGVASVYLAATTNIDLFGAIVVSFAAPFGPLPEIGLTSSGVRFILSLNTLIQISSIYLLFQTSIKEYFKI